jgi:hypothetical protein
VSLPLPVDLADALSMLDRTRLDRLAQFAIELVREQREERGDATIRPESTPPPWAWPRGDK